MRKQSKSYLTTDRLEFILCGTNLTKILIFWYKAHGFVNSI